jgi:dihydropteroate synthase
MNFEAFNHWLTNSARQPLLMGVLNVTPDSFSDGGKFNDLTAAVRHARQMIDDGADLIDVGGESTRPGSGPVSPDEQIRRTVPVIQAIAGLGTTISIDTTSAQVAQAAVDAGAGIINDVSAGTGDPQMLATAARNRVALVLMHKRGTPREMQVAPAYADVISEVRHYLLERAQAAQAAGVERDRIVLDVGIGFGKTLEHNLTLLREYRAFSSLGYATLLGTSRKAFIGTISGVQAPEDRLFGTAASVAWGVANGADIVRVHDVKEMRQVVEVIRAIRDV